MVVTSTWRSITKIPTRVSSSHGLLQHDTNDLPEYDDDTTIIPRSTSIVARRLPPTKPGKGTAQRYVSGKMPTNALPNAGRRERNFGHGSQMQKPAEMPVQVQAPVFTGAESEEDRIAAMFATSSEQWNKTQEQLAAYVCLDGNEMIFVLTVDEVRRRCIEVVVEARVVADSRRIVPQCRHTRPRRDMCVIVAVRKVCTNNFTSKS